jgi:hypothetical protein
MLGQVGGRLSGVLRRLDQGLRDGSVGRVGHVQDRIEKEEPPGEAGVSERQLHGQQAAAGLPDDDVPSGAQRGEIGGVTTEPVVQGRGRGPMPAKIRRHHLDAGRGQLVRDPPPGPRRSAEAVDEQGPAPRGGRSPRGHRERHGMAWARC